MGETTVLHIPFSGGLDEKIAKEYLDASSRQASILNGDFVKVGVVDKRSGLAHVQTALVAGGVLPALASGTRVVGWSRSSLSVLCSTGLYQAVSAPVGGTSAGGVVGVAKLPGVATTRRHITTGDQLAPPTLCDLTYSGTLIRIALFWDSVYNLQASVYEVASGNVILEPTLIYTNTGTLNAGTIPRIVTAFDLPGIADGNPRPVIVIEDLVDTSVKYIQYNPSTNTFTAPTTMVSACTVVDVVPYEDDPANGWLVFYDVGGTTMRLAYWTTAGIQTTVDQSLRVGDTLAYPCYACGRYGQSVWTVWSTHDTGNNRIHWAQRRTPDHLLGTPTAAYAFESIGDTGQNAGGFLIGAVHLGTNKIFVDYYYLSAVTSPGPTTKMAKWQVLQHNAGGNTISILAAGRAPLGLLAATRPFVVNAEVYQAFYYNLDYEIGFGTLSACEQITLYLCKFDGVSDSMSGGNISTDVCRPVSTVAPRTASHAAQGILDFLGLFHAGLPSTIQRTATQVAVGLKTIGDVALIAGGSWAVDFNWDAASTRNLYQTSELGAELSISGSVPFVADGQYAFEDGFFNYPELTYVKLEGSGTALSTAQYTFAVVYRAVDSSGLVHRSAPYVINPVSVTSGGAGPAIYITPPLASYRDVLASATAAGKVYADVYMTVADGATLYYKDSIVVSNISSGLSWPVAVRYPASGQVASLPDTTGPLLYTTGGVMSNVNPPASKIQITHQNRKAMVDETLRGVWFSKEFVEGEAPGFNESLYVPFPEGGDIAALGSMDGKFLAFKNRSIWLMDGQGPTVTGQGSSWTEPEPISTDVGCASWQSVVLTPKGLMFQAPNNGIYLLGRDLQVTFVGKSAIDRTNAYPDIASATLVPNSTQVRFVCLDAAGANHIVVVYDYFLDAWTTHQYGQLSGVPAATCLSYDSTPRYTVLTADGNLWQERLSTDPNRCQDQDSAGVNHFVPTTIKIPYIKTQVQGFQRMRRVQFFGEQQDDCGLQIQMSFNYDDTVRQTSAWTSAQLKSLNVKGQVETYVASAYNKQMSVQLTISDTAGTAMTSGAGMRFVAAALELQNLGPRYKLLSAGARR